MFVKHKIAEELDKKRLIRLYSLRYIAIVGTHQGIAEVPRIISEQVVIDLKL